MMTRQMTTEDRLQALLSRSQFAFWIQATAPDAFALMDLAPGALEATATREDFVGMVGFSGFVPTIALAVEIDDVSEQALTQAVIALVEQALIRLESRGRYQRQAVSDMT
jgi:hypothetical protein